MHARRWSDVKRLYDEVRDRTGVEREALLAAADPAAQAEVVSLLAAEARAGRAFLATGPEPEGASEPPGDPLLGECLGPYEITGVLGQGGMGRVYLARREAPARLVAIKLVRPGADARHAFRRIRAEAEMLARLEHPHIARLLDVGTAPDGRPYVVLEYVAGAALGAFCARARPDLRTRLRLFAALCDAVAYAHRRLVVHRDLKPANVLVTESGEPRLLDFGIGKLLDEERQETATGAGLRLMTPEYASPEQVRGEPVSVATDVHALGLLLHFLLTGANPFRLRTASPEELLRVVCHEDPPRPSLIATRPPAERAFEPPESPERLARALRGDLDAIVAQALRKEADSRYPSVEQLADDVRRHLAGEVVRAHHGTLAYRASKFARRNRLALSAAAAVALSLLSGLLVASWQTRGARAERARAERRFGDVRRLANAMLFPLYDKIRDLPGSTDARALLVTQALQYLDSLASEAPDQGLQRELAAAYRRVADVQGQPGAANLGDPQGALASYRKASKLLESLAASRAPDVELHSERAYCLLSIGRLFEDRGEFAPAEVSIRSAIEVSEAGLRLDAAHARLRSYLVTAGSHIGNLRVYQDDLPGAFAVLKPTLARAQAQAAESSDLDVQRQLSQVCVSLARAHREAREFQEALELYASARRLAETQTRQEPLNVRPRRSLALVRLESANVLSDMGRWREAGESLQLALEIGAQQLAADPHNALAQRVWMVKAGVRCRIEAHTRRTLSPACDDSLVRAQRLAAEHPGSTREQVDLLEAQLAMGEALKQLGRGADALGRLRPALALAQALFAQHPEDMRPRAYVVELQTNLGELFAERGAWSEAEAAFAAAIALAEPAAARKNARAAAQCFRALCSLGDAHARHAREEAGRERRTLEQAAGDAYRRALALLEHPDSRAAFHWDGVASRQRAERALAQLGSYAGGDSRSTRR